MAHTHTWNDMSGSWHEMTHTARDMATITKAEPSRQAFLMLWAAFALMPIVVGIDKFTTGLAEWSLYLAPWVNDIVPGSADQAMYAVGVVEIAAGLLVALMPRIGGYVVAAWLAAVIVNLVSQGEFYDIALRDFGLLVAAVALARLASTHHQSEA